MASKFGVVLKERLQGKQGPALVDELFSFLQERGQSYYDETVTQLQHALQCADLAQQREYEESWVTAALLHDVGHLLLDEHEAQQAFLAEDLNHEEIGAELLQDYFPAQVTEPVRLHVAAKRYLCSTDDDYYDRLSEASKRSFAVQGGKLSAEERAALEENPYLETALALRRLDDLGKMPDKETPELEAFAPCVLRCLRGQA